MDHFLILLWCFLFCFPSFWRSRHYELWLYDRDWKTRSEKEVGHKDTERQRARCREVSKLKAMLSEKSGLQTETEQKRDSIRKWKVRGRIPGKILSLYSWRSGSVPAVLYTPTCNEGQLTGQRTEQSLCVCVSVLTVSWPQSVTPWEWTLTHTHFKVTQPYTPFTIKRTFRQTQCPKTSHTYPLNTPDKINTH